MASLILIGGGVRSGKSRFALEVAKQRGTRLAFCATAQAFDSEMEERIAAHKEERANSFETIEAPYELVAALHSANNYDAIVVDCLTLWLSNQLLRGDNEAEILARVEELASMTRTFDLIVVTNEVGMGIVPESALGRAFRDLAGRAHQRLASHADELYAAMLGAMIRLRPAPITLVHQGEFRDA